MNDSNKFHELAKDAGNRLRAYILLGSSGATGLFFIVLMKAELALLTHTEKWLPFFALFCFFITVFLCLYELRIDAQRFFFLGKELEKPKDQQSWERNERFKVKRLRLIYTSYIFLGVGILSSFAYLISKIIGA